MRQPARLGTVSLVACAVVALTGAPAYALPVLEQAGRPAALLPLPDLPIPEVPVPTLPAPLPTPSATTRPLPDVPDLSDVSLPALLLPKVPSPKRPARRSPGPDEKAPMASSPAQQSAEIPATRNPGETKSAASASDPRTAAVVAGPHLHAQGAQRALDRVDDYLLSLVQEELCRALAVIVDPLPERITGLSPEVIAQLPPEIVNVVPERVLATASVRCPSPASGAGSDAGNSGPLTRVLGVLAHSGLLLGAVLPFAVGLLALGIALRRRAPGPTG